LAKNEGRDRLGKGLGALLGEYLEEERADGDMRDVLIARIRPNPFQPRREFADEALSELVDSIEENGLLQPLVVRPAGEAWELVAGERRLRALKKLGWERAPTLVRELSDEQMLIVALVENLQREALNAIEEAIAYQKLIDGFGLTQQAVAERVGRDRSTVANALRLLGLPADVRGMVSTGAISPGHGRAILAVPDPAGQTGLARIVASQGLSVRETERRARRLQKGEGPTSARDPKERRSDPVARRASTLLSRHLGTKTVVSLRGAASGNIRMEFYDATDFERLMRLLLSDGESEELFGVR
jgi:ParB family chromosome partitioning protein